MAFRKVASSGFTPGYLTQIRPSRFWYLLIPINLPLYRTKWQVRLERVVHYLYVRRFADMSTINRGGLKMGPPLLLTRNRFKGSFNVSSLITRSLALLIGVSALHGDMQLLQTKAVQVCLSPPSGLNDTPESATGQSVISSMVMDDYGSSVRVTIDTPSSPCLTL